jgi:chromosomal replication initiation ATPase DnaA
VSEQLIFTLPIRVAQGREDFFVSPSNRTAVALIDRTESWPNVKLALSGPAASGKTHLSHVWSTQVGARIISARELTDHDLPKLGTAPLVLEDLPVIAGQADHEEAAFHLHNILAEAGQPFLMTGRGAPRFWGLRLPDLQSRVEGAVHVELQAPDDELLAAVLFKLFADRQLVPRDNVIPYLIRQMERSFEAAGTIVELLDNTALAQSREITRDLAKEILGRMINP